MLARASRVLCELTLRLHAVGGARPQLRHAMHQTDLADFTGISTVHANRVVRDLRHCGVSDWGGKRVRIRDWVQLAMMPISRPSTWGSPRPERAVVETVLVASSG